LDFLTGDSGSFQEFKNIKPMKGISAATLRTRAECLSLSLEVEYSGRQITLRRGEKKERWIQAIRKIFEIEAPDGM
jgi:hypothetical protein